MVLSAAARQQQIRLDITSSVFHTKPGEPYWLRNRSTQWTPLLTWLDTSGLALRFFAHLLHTGQLEHIPPRVAHRLAQNLTDNTARMNAMTDQVVALHSALSRRNVTYALLKGLSLWPHSVPRLELRSQLDVDFLVSPGTLAQAHAALAEEGFYLQSRCGSSYEYKTLAEPPRSMAELYSVHPCRSVELHSADPPFRSAALSRRVQMFIRNEPIPVLAPCDCFLGQARHLYKHICSPCFRAAHLVEFAQHIRFRETQQQFWSQVRAAAESDPDMSFQLAFCITFLEQCLQTAVPGPLSSWASADRLPAFVTLWIKRYGVQLLTQDFPGSKLYLLLQYERDRHAAMQRRSNLRRSLLPLRPPPLIAPPRPHEGVRVRLRKLLRQALYICFRFRFHVASGAAFMLELPRWRRSVRMRQSNDIVLTHP